MKKSLYMKLQLCQDSDLQDYVLVSLSTARLTIFDLRTVEFVTYCIKQLVYSVSEYIDSLLTYRLLFNVSSYNRVVISVTDLNGDVLNSTDLDNVTLSYFRKITKSSFDKVDIPDVLVLLSYFITEKQCKLAGL